MSVDREQIRRDVAEELSGHSGRAPIASAKNLSTHCLALLAELEQAERELRLAIERAVDAEKEGEEALGALALEPRLAKVPALVEAGKALHWACTDPAARGEWTAALKAWEAK